MKDFLLWPPYWPRFEISVCDTANIWHFVWQISDHAPGGNSLKKIRDPCFYCHFIALAAMVTLVTVCSIDTSCTLIDCTELPLSGITPDLIYIMTQHLLITFTSHTGFQQTPNVLIYTFITLMQGFAGFIIRSQNQPNLHSLIWVSCIMQWILKGITPMWDVMGMLGHPWVVSEKFSLAVGSICLQKFPPYGSDFLKNPSHWV